ncbi:MAG TPA: alcohol dehydrogenase catalytic domain-containing protein [Dehalococcoidia bacterium]|nr:alcohol dehydrogenase catalytic domain-containing protein [Dehalococcoidia bacterium]
MKALVFHEPGRITVEERPAPEPGPGEALVRVAATSICHSDIRVFRGLKRASPGVIPGHEVAGVVAAVGPGVSSVRPGDRVAIDPIVADGDCFFCRQGKRNRCLNRVTLGYERDGGLAEYLLAPAALVAQGHLLPVPDGVPLTRACLTEPLACVLNSLETCRVAAGASLLLIGAGPMGLTHLIAARALGATTIVVSEPDAARRELARAFGASDVLDPQADDPVRATREATGGLGADAVVVTAGLPDVVPLALAAVRRQGVVNLFAGFPPGTTVTLDVNAVHYGELVLTGSQNATTDQYRRALALLARLPEIDRIVTHRFSIDDAVRAYDVRLAGEGLKSMVVFEEA